MRAVLFLSCIAAFIGACVGQPVAPQAKAFLSPVVSVKVDISVHGAGTGAPSSSQSSLALSPVRLHSVSPRAQQVSEQVASQTTPLAATGALGEAGAAEKAGDKTPSEAEAAEKSLAVKPAVAPGSAAWPAEEAPLEVVLVESPLAEEGRAEESPVAAEAFEQRPEEVQPEEATAKSVKHDFAERPAEETPSDAVPWDEKWVDGLAKALVKLANAPSSGGSPAEGTSAEAAPVEPPKPVDSIEGSHLPPAVSEHMSRNEARDIVAAFDEDGDGKLAKEEVGYLGSLVGRMFPGVTLPSSRIPERVQLRGNGVSDILSKISPFGWSSKQS